MGASGWVFETGEMVRRALIILAILLFMLLLGAGGAWLMRGSIVQYFLAQACQDRGFICETERADASLSSIGLEKLRVTDTSNTPVASGDVRIDLKWPGLFQPSVSAITINQQPSLNVRYDGRSFSLGDVALSNLMSGQGGSAAIPAITVEETTLTLETPAGTLSGMLSADGVFPQDGTLKATLTPADLSQNGYRVSLNEGEIDLRLEGEIISGRSTLNIAKAVFPGQELDNAVITLDLDAQSRPTANWSLTADRIKDSRIGLFNDVEVTSQTVLSQRPYDLQVFSLDIVDSAVIEAKSGQSEAINRRAESLVSNVSLERETAGGPYVLNAEADIVSGVGPFGTAERGTLTISGNLDPDLSIFDLEGRVVATNVAANDRAAATVVNLIPVSAPLQAHGRQLRQASGQALSGFSGSADFSLLKSGEEATSFRLNGPIALKAASGANILLTPRDARPTLISTSGRTEMSGLLSARSGGLPETTVLLRELRSDAEGLNIRTGGAEIKNWRADGVTLSANLTEFALEQTPDAPLRTSGSGRLVFDGPIFGVDVTGGEVFGALNAVRSGRNWRVETQNQTCLGFDYDQLRLAPTLVLGASALRLCPPQGRLLATSSDGFSGALGLGTIDIPVSGERFQGQFGLSDAALDWRADGDLSMSVAANSLTLPLSIDGRSLRVETASPNLRLALNPALDVSAMLGVTQLSGDLVPANLEIAETRLTGGFFNSGFLGSAQTSDVRVSDFRDDPLYQPFLGDLTADFEGADMRVSGPFRLASTSELIGFAEAEINLFSLTGTANMETPILVFSRNGLKPRQISERLRGLFPDAVGSAQGRADFRIDRGQLSGDGRFTLTDFGFSTSRLGPVVGVNGTVIFDDVIAISTPPKQTFTIERLNPGLPLNNGTVEFQVLQGREARLEDARWPFAGGSLSVAPSRWTISGTEDTVEVRADRIELKQLIDTLKVPDLEAEGTLSGTFPIELRAGATFVNDARFKVDDEGGRLAYRGAVLESAGGTNESVNSAFQALQNLQYSVLEVSLNGNLLGDITLGALLVGRNPDVLGGSEFEFDISIDSKLAQLLQTGREAASQGWLTQAVARQVEEQNAETPSPQE
ncbi:MAG: YdbH domain-containing protein [Pseudomonadota bacterium]